METFHGKTVLVGGATGNLGMAVARKFLAAGAQLILTGRDMAGLDDSLAGVSDESQRVIVRRLDLTAADQVESLVQDAIARFGRIDVLANTVGGFRKLRIQDSAWKDWECILSLNLKTAYLLSRAVLPQMRAQGSGRIVHVSARAALSAGAGMSAYSASKAAVIRLTESLAAEMRDDGITVNCVLPGTIDTPENRKDMPNADYSRWVAPEAIADVFLFLASEAAQAISGAAIPVYGRS
jgi:NAD(P)-dependent dehydrogenase (short-subunit alcohol dehydrogenase family)